MGLIRWCADRRIPLHAFEWATEHGRAGLARDAVYLLRPDTYVAMADASGGADALERYFSTRGLRITESVPAAST